MAAGDLRVRVTIEQPSGVPDAAGHVDLDDPDNWTDVGVRWASVIPRGGGERVVFDQVAAEVTHVVELRSDSLTRTIQPTWQFRLGSRLLRITAIYDPDGRRRIIQAACTEVVT